MCRCSTPLCKISLISRSGTSTRGVNQGREPRSSHPSLTPSQLYRTQDGFIFIMCNKKKFWPVLCEIVGRPEWATNEDYKDFKARLRNRGS